MSSKLNRVEIGNGVNFSWIPDEKFKHNQISMHFLLPLDINTVSDNSMIPLLLRKGSKNYPDFSLLNAQLNRLYGASLSAYSSKFNGYQRLTLSIRFLDNRYVMNNENLIQQCSAMLTDIVFNPNFNKDGVFFEEDFLLEQQYLVDSIESEINDKRIYSINRTIEEMYKGEPLAIPQNGTVETAKKTTPQSVAAAWKNMLTTGAVEVIFTGAGDPEYAKTELKKAFESIERKPIDFKIVKMADKAEEVSETRESLKGLEQGKLVMGLRIAGIETLEDEYATRLFSAAYGGTPFSKLFLNVRERLSLCYYCAARADVVNHMLLVDSGVEKINMAKAKDEIMNQLKVMQNGDITDEELANTKLLLNNAITNTLDTLGGIESWYLGQILKGTDISPMEDVVNINKVTKEQIVKIANGVTLDTVYYLTGKAAE